MGPNRKLSFASTVAVALCLAGCGGDGGGGIASTPPAPLTPVTPTPTPTQSGGPARATTGAGPAASVFASAAGPNFRTGPAAATVFPMLQTAMTQNGTRYQADSSTNAAGGAATFNSGQVTLSIPDSRPDPWLGYADLDWTRAGHWSVSTDWFTIANADGAFVIGFETPPQAVPTTGTATFNGRAEGTVFTSSSDRAAIELTGGTAAFTANFAARTLSGSVTGLAARDTVNGFPTGSLVPWNDFSFTSTITANSFSGDTRVTSAPGAPTSLGGSATGTIEGKFFGPTAQEAGAVWTLFDGTSSAIGTLTGKRP
jgi:hypothetical protein